MDINEKRNFRSRVLEVHYEISDGNLWSGVMRPNVAEKLQIDDYNDDELLSAIKYLESKGFLQVGSNVDDRITVYGVDEVESGYPTLGAPISNRDEEEKVQLILVDIANAEKLASKGLLRMSELTALRDKITSLLTDTLDINSEIGREYDRAKRTTTWTEESRTGYITDIGSLNQDRQFLLAYLESLGGKPVKKEVYIEKGSYYTGRQYVRAILKEASLGIDIQDSYIQDTDFLNIIEPYVATNDQLKVRILTQKVSGAFKSDLGLFTKQFPNVEARINKDCHDRFIIIDNKKIYHSGHSFKDLGGKASAITLLEDAKEIHKILEHYQDWWNRGGIIE